MGCEDDVNFLTKCLSRPNAVAVTIVVLDTRDSKSILTKVLKSWQSVILRQIYLSAHK